MGSAWLLPGSFLLSCPCTQLFLQLWAVEGLPEVCRGCSGPGPWAEQRPRGPVEGEGRVQRPECSDQHGKCTPSVYRGCVCA